MFKKPILLIVVLAWLLTLPASASAYWQFEENPIPGDAFELHGNIEFVSHIYSGGIRCAVQISVTLKGGTTTAETSQAGAKGLPTEGCKGEGTLAFCAIHSVEYSATPSTLHITETSPATLSITTEHVQYAITGGFCPSGNATLTPGTLTFTPDNVNAMKTVTVSGNLSTHIPGASGSATVSGDLKVTPEGLYGI